MVALSYYSITKSVSFLRFVVVELSRCTRGQGQAGGRNTAIHAIHNTHTIHDTQYTIQLYGFTIHNTQYTRYIDIHDTQDAKYTLTIQRNTPTIHNRREIQYDSGGFEPMGIQPGKGALVEARLSAREQRQHGAEEEAVHFNGKRCGL